MQLQEQIGQVPPEDEIVAQSEGSESERDEAQASFSDADDVGDGANHDDYGEEDDCNADEDTPTEYDEDDEALDEIERRIAEQEKALHDIVDDKA